MNGDTPEFRALLRRLRQQPDEETDSYLNELTAACANAAESYECCLRHLQRLIDGYTGGRVAGDAIVREIIQQVTKAEQKLAEFRGLLTEYESRLLNQGGMPGGIDTMAAT